MIPRLHLHAKKQLLAVLADICSMAPVTLCSCTIDDGTYRMPTDVHNCAPLLCSDKKLATLYRSFDPKFPEDQTILIPAATSTTGLTLVHPTAQQHTPPR
jgi:hypothetical protein